MSAQNLKSAFKSNLHLFKYFHKLDHVPFYVEQLSRGESEELISVIYPVGDPVFIHVQSRGSKERRLYIPIEPIPATKGFSNLMESVEIRLAEVIGEEVEFRDLADKRRRLVRFLERIVKRSDKLKPGTFYISGSSILVSKDVWIYLEYNILKEKAGAMYLEPMTRDPYIEDISIPGAGPVFVEHKVFESCESTLSLDLKTLKQYAERLGQIIGRQVSIKRPIVDGSLPDGSRINIVYGDDISLKGPNITIRKFNPTPLSIVELCRHNTLSYKMAAYLWMLLDSNMNVWFCGETASGKTTLLNACMAFIPFNYKVVTIEDTPEVITPHSNWVRESTRDSAEGAGVTLFDLLKAALRQRPNYIVVGEIRGKEGNVAFQAMQTGHGCIATFHAGSVEKLIQRLTSYPIEVPKTFLDNLNAVTVQSAVRHPRTGKLVRRVLGIYELIGFDIAENRFQFIEVFSWDPSSDISVFRGEGTSYLLEEKIARMRGISRRELRKIYHELENREEILRIADYMGLKNYYQLFDLFKEVRLKGPSNILTELRKGSISLAESTTAGKV
jgi:flagellar protein FlaI